MRGPRGKIGPHRMTGQHGIKGPQGEVISNYGPNLGDGISIEINTAGAVCPVT